MSSSSQALILSSIYFLSIFYYSFIAVPTNY